MVARSPEQVWIGEVQWRLSILLPAIVRKFRIAILLGICPKDSFFRKEQVEDDLRIQGPVSRIIEYKDRVNLERFVEVREIHGARKWPGRLLIVIGEDLIEGPDSGVFHKDITRRNNVFEAVPYLTVSTIVRRSSRGVGLHLRDLSALVTIPASHQDCLILQALDCVRAFDKLLERGMRLHKVLLGEGDTKLLAEFRDPRALVLPASIGEQDEGDVVLM